MIKWLLSLGLLTSLTYAADFDHRQETFSGATPLPPQHIQVVQDLGEIKEEKQTTSEALGSIASNSLDIVVDKGEVEWQRAKNRIHNQAARTEAQADQVYGDSRKKLKKLEKKGKQKTQKLKHKAKKFL